MRPSGPQRSSWMRKGDSKNSSNMTSSFLGRHDYAEFQDHEVDCAARSERVLAHSYGSLLRIKMDSALNRPVEDWGKLLADVAAVTAMLDRILHHGHVLKCGPRSWRTKTAAATAGGTQ